MDEQPIVNMAPIEDMLKRMNVSAVFGEPIREGETTLIPVASVIYGFGYGSGYGHGPGGAPGTGGEGAPSPEQGEGAGAGGGAGGRVKPQGYVRISGGEVRYEPLINPTILSLAGIAFTGWAVFWIAATIRALAGKSCCD
jgi:uncharacterized spore protein YtfJ